jgi:nicotinate-nucleotide--dimethylbenzimidazole phosphoribosyltransferase
MTAFGESTVTSDITFERARRAIDAKTKPLGALGRLETLSVRLAVLQNTLTPSVDVARVCVFGADHGVAEDGVSAYPRAVTAEMMKNFGRGGAAINVIGAACGVQVEVIDVGVDADLTALTTIRHHKIRPGSRHFGQEPAMTEDEFDAALAVGADAVRRAVADGVQAIGLGEMGIGNTTAASAVLAALTGLPANETVGRGTGVDDATLAHKRAVIDAALVVHGASRTRLAACEALRRLGGLELAAIAGAALEAARQRIACVADGFISTVAVLCAERMAAEGGVVSGVGNAAELDADAVRACLFFAHRSAERGHTLALETLARVGGCDTAPLLDLGMRLGEGSGAALAMPVLRAAAAVMHHMATFESAGVSAGAQSEQHRDESDA